MTSDTVSTARLAAASRLSTKNKVGAVLCIVLRVFDVISPFMVPSGSGPADQGPPMSVLVVDAVLGLVTVAAAVLFWRSGNRVGARVAAGTRVLSSLSSLPAFFVGGVSAGLIALAAGGILASAISIWLILSRPSTS